ncbi:DUF397 domain-containing protein [Streptomyces sp. NPDC048172]|uniref:DUF397 domain-containing protein n=1 Tax=Streptomyces sp. NPDC048172 TaxID=3365505 RepID=UPI003713CE5F
MENEHVIPDASALTAWRKSSYSGGGNGDCIEVCDAYPSGVPVRDSKTPEGPALLFGASAWTSFLNAVRDETANR